MSIQLRYFCTDPNLFVQLLVVVPALVAGLEAALGTDLGAEMLEKMPAQLSELNFNDFNFNFNEFPILSRLGEAVARLDLAGGAG